MAPVVWMLPSLRMVLWPPVNKTDTSARPTFAGPQLQRLLVEFGDKMGDFCGDERILAENRRLNVAWVSTQLRLYWSKEGVYASYTLIESVNSVPK